MLLELIFLQFTAAILVILSFWMTDWALTFTYKHFSDFLEGFKLFLNSWSISYSLVIAL